MDINDTIESRIRNRIHENEEFMYDRNGGWNLTFITPPTDIIHPEFVRNVLVPQYHKELNKKIQKLKRELKV